jgi:acyl-[acyl-carrier-protein]-phospholipid O-acyltransferase / long-chain-fatty-acid--[acyl-carrier-protein] ligase
MPSAPGDKSIVFDWNVPRQTMKLLGYARERDDVFWAVIGASWFWFLGAAIMAQFPVFTQGCAAGQRHGGQHLHRLFTIGIGAGSLLTTTLLKGDVSPRYVPVASIMMTVFLLDLYFAAGAPMPIFAGTADLNGVETFFSMVRLARGHRSLLHRLLRRHLCRSAERHHAAPLEPVAPLARDRGQQCHERHLHDHVGRCCRNAASLHVGARLLPSPGDGQCGGGDLDLPAAAAGAGFANVARQVLFRLLLPRRSEGHGELPRGGPKGGHRRQPHLAARRPLLSAFLPERASFAINTPCGEEVVGKPTFALFNMIPIDPTNPMALRVLVDELKKGRKVVIFPEGRLTVTGALMKVYEGPGAIAQMAKARVLPVRIDGALYTPFSRMRGKLRLRWFPKITITFLPPVKFDPPEGMRGAALREHQADRLYDVMTDMVFRTSNIDRTLFQALLDARAHPWPRPQGAGRHPAQPGEL